MPNFTEKPWRVSTDDAEAGIYYVRAAYGPYAREDEANARLISAAPDMFFALLECEVLLNEYPIILRQVKAAIAKAEGK